MDYKTRLAEIRRQHQLRADRDAFTQFMAAHQIPIDFVKLDSVPLGDIFKKMDRPSVEPYKVVDGLKRLEWREELIRAAESLMSGTSAFLFCWREILGFEKEHLLVFNPAHLEKWLDAYNPSLRESDLLCCDLDRRIFIVMLIDEHDVKFKRLMLEDFLPK